MTKILIIEDEGSIRKGLAEILRLEGFEILTAEDGQAGANLAEEYLPDIIISDILMPVMNGHQVLKHLNSLENTKHIPFIFISALADRDDLRKGMNSGADDYLTKPFTRAELLNAIHARLEKAKTQKERIDHQIESFRDQHNSGLLLETMTPLNNLTDISNYLEILAEKPDKQLILNSVSDLKSNIEKLRHLIEKHDSGNALVNNGNQSIPDQ